MWLSFFLFFASIFLLVMVFRSVQRRRMSRFICGPSMNEHSLRAWDWLMLSLYVIAAIFSLVVSVILFFEIS